jgi:hypothetical protein
MLSGGLVYASTTVIAYWFPMTAFIMIFASQVLWIVMSIAEDEK